MNIDLDLSKNNIYEKIHFQHKTKSVDHINVVGEFNFLPKWLKENKEVSSISFCDKKKTDQLIFNPFSNEPDYFTCREEKLNYLPEEICLLTNMETLDIGLLKGYGNVQQLPKNIGNLKKLKSLLLGKNQILQLPESIKNCKEITWLSIIDNPLKEFPEVIYELFSLEILNIGSENYNSIEVDLINLNKLKNLNSLSLINCEIREFPLKMENLNNLKALCLNDNLIEDLPNPKLVKESFKKLNLIDLRRNPVYEENFEFSQQWRIQLLEYGITVYFS